MNTPLQKFKNYCRKTDARLFFVADDGAILFSARFIASLISYLTTIVSLPYRASLPLAGLPSLLGLPAGQLDARLLELNKQLYS